MYYLAENQSSGEMKLKRTINWCLLCIPTHRYKLQRRFKSTNFAEVVGSHAGSTKIQVLTNSEPVSYTHLTLPTKA